MVNGADFLLWIDLEMTGLDPEREKIIEIASLVTTKDLELVAEGPHLVIHQPDELLEKMDNWNKKHHKRSGLLADVRSSKVTTEIAEAKTMEFVTKHCLEKKIPLVGNSIHTDRTFLVKEMPKLNAWIHYRNIDVSSIKELALRWYPEIYRQRPSKHGDHRARGDILESVEELKFYRERIFRQV